MSAEHHDRLFESISALAMRHSPSGMEDEVDALLKVRFDAIGLHAESDASGNLLVKIPGSGSGSIAITAHKDEIGATVTKIEEDGRLRVRKRGSSFPWVYGEGVVDVLGSSECVSGVLSFGSRHVTHASPQHAHRESAPVRWSDAWVETKRTRAELDAAGIRPGTPMVIGKHRKAPFRMKDYIASYALDDKASLAILLELAKRLRTPRPDVYLVATTREEVSASGALYFTRRHELDALIALEICPLAPEYAIEEGAEPVLLAEDDLGPYDHALNETLRRAASRLSIPLQIATISSFASDASIALKAGHVPRAACLGFATQNTHGYEIAHLGAMQRCIELLDAVCLDGLSDGFLARTTKTNNSRKSCG